MKIPFKSSSGFCLHRSFTLILVFLAVLSAALVPSACKKAPSGPAINEKNGKAVFTDPYVTCELPSGYSIAVDNTEDMGTAYHAYLMFKKNDDNTGSQIVYYSMYLRKGTYENMVTDQVSVEANLRNSYESKGLPLEIVSFRPVTQSKCRGYIIEYKTESGGHQITQILYNAITADSNNVTFSFNCTDDTLLPDMREAVDSIRLNIQ